jgi:hypothetical protein
MSPHRLDAKLRSLAFDKRLLERRLRHSEAELECVELLLVGALRVIDELGGAEGLDACGRSDD